jgi:nucleoside-diphosphate-sugar epimerase
MRPKIKKALVTGGAGFIGSHLVDALVAQGSKVTVLDDLSSGNLSNLDSVKDQIIFFKNDIRERRILEQAAADCDVIFHLAAVVSVPETIERPIDSAMINDLGILFVLEAARSRKVGRVLFASSCAVYGDDPRLPKEENMNPHPCSPYAVQKLTAEYYLRLYHDLYGLKTASLRYFNVYGPRQDPSSPYSGVISIFMAKAVERLSPVIFGDGNQSRDFVYVKDVVKANLLAAVSDHAGDQPINIGTGNCVRINQLWDMVCSLSGFRIKAQYQPARPGDIYTSLANAERAKSWLGFEPEVEFEKGLELTFEWYKHRQTTGDRR